MQKPKTLVLLLVTICASSMVTAARTDKSGPDYSKESFVLEQSSDKFKFENDGSYAREIRMRTRIQSDAGVEHFSVLRFAFQSSLESFAIDYVRVVKQDGTTVVTPADTYQDMPADISRQAPLYSDAHEMQVAVKGLGVGDVLEYQVHWKHDKPLIPGQFWLEYSFAKSGIVLDEKLEVSVPHGRKPKLKSDRIKPTVLPSGAYDVYSWTNSNLADKDEKKEKQERQELAWQQARGRTPSPDMQLSSFQSWDEVAKWYGGLQRERVNPGAEIQAKAAEVTKGLTDESAKIRALYDFVSTKYRYIGIDFGIGRYQPHSAAEVLANQYGDCKDKHTLFAALLKAAGIRAYPALISSEREIDSDVPSPGQFDHVITAISQGSGFEWLDTTAEVAPFGMLLPVLRDKHALIIVEDKPAVLATTPADDPFPAVQRFEMQAKLSDAGVLDGKAESTDRGDTEVVFRSVFRIVPLVRWKDLVQRISSNIGFAGEVSGVEATPPEKTAEAFHFSYAYKRKDYSDWSNRRITPPLPPISLPDVDDDIEPIAPIWLGSPGEIDFRATVELPKGYTPELPKAVHLKQNFADYDATYSFSSGVITAVRHLTIKLREIPARQYAEYKSFRKAVNDDYGTYTLLSVGRKLATPFSYQDEIWNLPYSQNGEAARLYDDARERANHGDKAGEIATLTKAVELDPKFVRAWLWLGEIHKELRQNDFALQSYRKAIEIDPEQAVSYKALGFTLATMGKSEEAEAVWQQFVKALPNSVDAEANWGNALLAAKHFREAIPPLESAVKLAPDEALLELSLGNAYLNADETELARASFQKTLSLDSSSMLLNDVAYALAEKNIDLDKAKDYALKAVIEEETEASKTDITALKPEDLSHPGKLTSFWDTLGWTYFRLNDLDSAERYLKAAWVLSQSGTIGEHLGRVYEKQGKKRDAIYIYQLAYGATPAVPVSSPNNGTLPMFKRNTTLIEEDLHRMGAPLPTYPGAYSVQSDLNDLRTIKLPRLIAGTANAEFFIVLGPGKKVEAKFISGSDALKNADISPRASKSLIPFPDEHPTRIVRRGILGCYPSSGCTLVMIPTNAVSFIQ